MVYFNWEAVDVRWGLLLGPNAKLTGGLHAPALLILQR